MEVQGIDTGGTYRPLKVDANGGLMRTYYARECMCTGYASGLTNAGVEILPASSGAFTDLLMITASTTSNLAVSIDLKTGTTTVMTMVIPAASTITLPFSMAIPSYQRSHGWTAGFSLTGQTTGTTATVFAVGIRNIN